MTESEKAAILRAGQKAIMEQLLRRFYDRCKSEGIPRNDFDSAMDELTRIDDANRKPMSLDEWEAWYERAYRLAKGR
jgi:hypothetical protein